MKFARILGTGGYLPERILTNADLERIVDTTDEWIVERTGIRERRLAEPGQSAADMGEIAARRALEMAEVSADSIDLIIVATCTPDRVFPSTACLLQQRLGANGGAAFDVSAACAGFLYALGTADNFIRAGAARRVLVIGTEVMSRVIDWQDRATCVLFADGAGALVLEAQDSPGIVSTHLHADGRHQDLLWVPGWVSADYEAAPAEPPYMRMNGGEVFKVAVRELGRSVDEAVAANDMSKADIDWLVPHQANLRIISAVAKRLALPMEQVIVTIDRHGNTSSASVPLALDEAVRDGRIQSGQTLVLEAFGGGFAWGSALVRY